VAALASRLPQGGRVYTPGCAAEPLALAEAYRAQPEAADGLTFLGVWIPGVNRTDWAGLTPASAAVEHLHVAGLAAFVRSGSLHAAAAAYTQAWRGCSARR
jgi:hypothetical protein